MRAILVSPEIPKSFWAFPETLKGLGIKAPNPPLGLITMAALLPADWGLRLCDLNVRDLTDDDWQWAELVMISGMIVQRNSMLAVIREAKRRDKTVVVGGPYPTSLPDEPLEAGADFVVRGEAENALELFLSALKKGEKRGVFAVEPKPDMTTSPIPRYDLLNVQDYATMLVQSSRGCPFDCEFCDIVNLYGRKMRYKNPEQVLSELERIYGLGWRDRIFVTDDNFIGSKARAKAILEALIPWNRAKGEPFHFWCQGSVNLGNDPEMIHLMTAANFKTVIIGVESVDEDVLALNRKYHNIRNRPLECLDTIKRNGLEIIASFIIGFDGEKKGMGQLIAGFVEESGVPLVVINLLQILPNTALWRRLKSEGRLLTSSTTGDFTGGVLTFIPSRPASEVVEEYVAACESVYDPQRFLARVYRYFTAMRPTRKALGIESGPPSSSVAAPLNPFPTAKRLREIRYLLRHVWRHAVLAPYRMQLWKQLWGIRSRNPSRFKQYAGYCILADDIAAIAGIVRERSASTTERLDAQTP